MVDLIYWVPARLPLQCDVVVAIVAEIALRDNYCRWVARIVVRSGGASPTTTLSEVRWSQKAPGSMD